MVSSVLDHGFPDVLVLAQTTAALIGLGRNHCVQTTPTSEAFTDCHCPQHLYTINGKVAMPAK